MSPTATALLALWKQAELLHIYISTTPQNIEFSAGEWYQTNIPGDQSFLLLVE